MAARHRSAVKSPTASADTVATDASADLHRAARSCGLVYVAAEGPGIARRRTGKGFAYRDEQGVPVRDPDILGRIRSLAIPPAYQNVWICHNPDGHIQAVGRDAKGRRQYRYHPDFRAMRDTAKYEHMLEFARLLPELRQCVTADMGKRGLGREKVLATVVHLLETTMIRVGNEDYAKHNDSFGLTTLQDPHVDVSGAELRFAFNGKSGKTWQLQVHDRRVAKIVKSCQDLPGQHLFQYLDADGVQQKVSSADVNTYLRDVTGADVTAKDFRTWTGTVLAALALSEFESFDTQALGKKNIRDAIIQVAERLGNTPTICRKCYVHPGILTSYLNGSLALKITSEIEAELSSVIGSLRPEEAVVLAFLHHRLAARDSKRP